MGQSSGLIIRRSQVRGLPAPHRSPQVYGSAAGARPEELLGGGREAAQGYAALLRAAAVNGRLRGLFDGYVAIAGYGDVVGGRARRVFLEVKDPLALERAVTLPRAGASRSRPSELAPVA